jgi:AmpE protein
MTLISLLLVLLVERVTTKSRYWQAEFYIGKYLHFIESKYGLTIFSTARTLALLILVPILVLYLLIHNVTGGLVEFLLSTTILMVCVGCPAIRATYKCFLQAANLGDQQACSIYQEQISGNNEEQLSFGLNLVWQNYRHYTAVILWFAILGAPGAVLYVLVRELECRLDPQGAKHGKTLLTILDWVPVRITALGFLLVGHFSRAFPTWLSYFADPNVSAKTLLLDVSKKAEEIEPDENDCTEEPCTLVRLAKRNVMFLLVIIAILTLSGWVN